MANQAVFAELVWEPTQGATHPMLAARSLTSTEFQRGGDTLWQQALPCQNQFLCTRLEEEEAHALEEVAWDANDVD